MPPEDQTIVSLWVGGVTTDMEESDLFDVFYAYGKIQGGCVLIVKRKYVCVWTVDNIDISHFNSCHGVYITCCRYLYSSECGMCFCGIPNKRNGRIGCSTFAT